MYPLKLQLVRDKPLPVDLLRSVPLLGHNLLEAVRLLGNLSLVDTTEQLAIPCKDDLILILVDESVVYTLIIVFVH